VGTEKAEVSITPEQLAAHIPQKVDYRMGDLYLDLLNFSYMRLPKGGRLVFWVPVVREDYSRRGEESLPR